MGRESIHYLHFCYIKFEPLKFDLSNLHRVCKYLIVSTILNNLFTCLNVIRSRLFEGFDGVWFHWFTRSSTGKWWNHVLQAYLCWNRVLPSVLRTKYLAIASVFRMETQAFWLWSRRSASRCWSDTAQRNTGLFGVFIFNPAFNCPIFYRSFYAFCA
jgi:hypothetical protein